MPPNEPFGPRHFAEVKHRVPYQQLDAEKIIETVAVLDRRIKERFPGAGLSNVCEKLVEIARSARDRSALIARPILWVRAISATIIALVLISAGSTAWLIAASAADDQSLTVAEQIQALEAAINDVVLIGATVFFLITLETRIKRGRALKAVHELRAMAHIIDMHQLTKDPEQMLEGGKQTRSSPRRTMTRFELSRYLDYCSEMLALVGKVAALYVQNFEDSVAVSAVNEVENLTSDMSRKIWQKLMVLHAVDGEGHRSLVVDERPAVPTPTPPAPASLPRS